MTFIQIILYLIIISAFVGFEYILFFGGTQPFMEKIPTFITDKLMRFKKCSVADWANVYDYSGKALNRDNVDCQSCSSYVTKSVKGCTPMEFKKDGTSCTPTNDTRMCPF